MTDAPWWRSAVVYQIYPRSFADSDGDGIGDLRGIIGRVDHLARLGVDVVWLSPIYPSPQDDAGYDISDYENVDPTFGTLADLDELIAALHDAGSSWSWTSWSTTPVTSTPGSSSRAPTRAREARLVLLATGARGHGTRAAGCGAEQLGLVLLGTGLGARPGVRRVLPAPVLTQAARPQLGEPAGPRGGVPDDARLGGARRRRLPDGRRQLHLEGRGPGRVAARRDRDPGTAPYGNGAAGFICGPRIHEYLAEMRREVFAGPTPRCSPSGRCPA